MLHSVHLPWQVAVEMEFRCYSDLDISSWVQTLRVPDSEIFAVIVSALHPLPRGDVQSVQINDVDEMISRYAGVPAC